MSERNAFAAGDGVDSERGPTAPARQGQEREG